MERSLEHQLDSKADAGTFTKLGFRLSNWTRNYINCSKRGAFFVSGLVFSHGLADNSVMCILISYFMENWQKNRLRQAAEVVNVEGGVSAVVAIIVSFVSDAYLCRFKVIACTTILCIIGLVLLGVSTWLTPEVEVRCFYPIVLLIAVGKAGRERPLKAFLFDQLVNVKENQEIDVEAQKNLWWQLAWSLGLLASFVLSVYSWRITFLTSAVVMAVAYVWFWSGIRFYCYNEPTGSGSHLNVVLKVFKSAILKRHLVYPNIANGYFKNHTYQLPLCPNVPFFRWLDKAAIIEEYSDELKLRLQEQELKGRLCSASEVKQVKCLLTIVPIWTTFAVYGMVEATGRTFFIEQSNNLDNNIGTLFVVPVTLIFKLKSLITLLLSFLLKLLIPKWLTGTKRQHILLVRMGLGMLFSMLSCISAWQVEVHRLNLVKNERICDQRTIPMSVFWLVPQFIMLGLMAGFAEDGFRDLIYNNQGFIVECNKKPIFESSAMDCAMGIGNLLSLLFVFIFRAWIGDSINSSRLDKYFLLLAIMNIGNISLFCLVIIVLYKFLYCEEAGHQENEKLCLHGNLEDGLTNSVSDNSSNVFFHSRLSKLVFFHNWNYSIFNLF